MAGLSGGQRKLLLFQLLFQRTGTQENMLIIIDEPFAGVTDEFVPFIVERLCEMRTKHNILLVTNDHVNILMEMADNTISVSTIDRSKVKINGREGVDRYMTLLAMSIGDEYKYKTNDKDLEFFVNVEFSKHSGIFHVSAYVILAFGLFVLSFWSSKPGSEALVLVAAGNLAFFTANPYILQLTDWRVFMVEETEALVHSSLAMNKHLKASLTLFLLFIITLIQFGCQELVLGAMMRAEFTRIEFFVGILFDNVFQLIALICLGLYTEMTDQMVQILGQVPFLLSIFFSTTYSPGAGIEGVKELRYLFPNFYVWCMLPEMGVEGCPAENKTLLYLIMSSLITPFLFLLWKFGEYCFEQDKLKKEKGLLNESMHLDQYVELQKELFPELQKELFSLSQVVGDEDDDSDERLFQPRGMRVDGPLVVIGLGSIGRGMLPLIERHIGFDRDEFAVVEPSDDFAHLLEEHGARHVRVALTAENLESTLRGLFPRGGGMIVNLSVDVDSVAVMVLAQDLGALYVDTVIEPWPGVYFASSLGNAERTNYALRERMRETGRKFAGGSTAVSSCGANPGMVSWLMKEALLRLSEDTGVVVGEGPPETREGWARLAMVLGVKGVHVAERDTQVSSTPKTPGVFVNTWSVDGFLSEGYQPAELGWGTHERRMPTGGRRHDHGNDHGIWIDRPGGDTRVRSWVPGTGPQLGLLVTHNEALSIADYYTVWDGDDAVYRPTCHYAYHPCNDAVLSLYETIGAGQLPEKKHILTADEIVSGNDDLGVLLYGHAKGAMWYGSRLSIDEARRLAPYQNATGMQVTSAVLAGMVWALENPKAGFVEADEMDHVRCLQIQRPYLGSVECHYTDWTPVRDRINTFGEDREDEDPWQFTNFLAV